MDRWSTSRKGQVPGSSGYLARHDQTVNYHLHHVCTLKLRKQSVLLAKYFFEVFRRQEFEKLNLEVACSLRICIIDSIFPIPLMLFER